MQIQNVDFPSDPRCFLPKDFRKIMTKALHKAAASPEAEKVLKEQLGFVVKKMKGIPAEREQRAKAVKALAVKNAAKVDPISADVEEGSE